MVKKNPILAAGRRDEKVNRYTCDLTLWEAISKIYPDCRLFNYPHGEAGKTFEDNSFVSFNGRIGTVVYGFCDFLDKKNVPLSSTNLNDLKKLGVLKLKDA